jgi:hypothetical protein
VNDNAELTVSTLVVVELGVRVLGIQPPEFGEDEARNKSDRLANEATLVRNSLGYHDQEWRLAKPSDTWRVFFLGDSFTESPRVELDDTFVKLIERSLNESALGGRRHEFFSVARAGWNTVQEYNALVDLLPYEPDAVVIVYFINDATGMDSRPLLAERLGTYAYERDGFLNRLSAAYDYFDYRWRRRVVTRESFRDYHESFLGSKRSQHRWMLSKHYLGKTRKLADERQLELGLVVYPVLVQLHESHSLRGLYNMVEAYSAKLGIPSMSLLPAFNGEDPESLWVSPVSSHPNAAAHAIVVDPIETFLRETGIVPD